ncbi:hypothetical protein DEU56DRAFT_751944 [Suillus clintonianus]|uniref:uncharacterized protein n=1 Tax=Suillus clintonianus TaxID=1904413 RepID=UPI001B8787D9|nr:uncharacterized protein DEU56DRAFT_751944 [Suillus clintonianus]KAG2153364.1 hypothetical protein DEU56DRAFT_751944 [Suillus clintonianus]
MSGQGDLERADPGSSMDVQRDEQVRGKTEKDAKKPTTGDHSSLVAAWMQRLQTLTVITTFLTTIDGQLFTLSSASTTSGVKLITSTQSQEFVYACFAGALVFHVCSSILGYVACFALIRYEIVDADPSSVMKHHDHGERYESIDGKQLLIRAVPPLYAIHYLLQTPSNLRLHSRTITPPLDLLTRCYYMTFALSSLGFILALLGIVTYAWFGLQRVVGIFTMSCLGFSLAACVLAVVY